MVVYKEGERNNSYHSFFRVFLTKNASFLLMIYSIWRDSRLSNHRSGQDIVLYYNVQKRCNPLILGNYYKNNRPFRQTGYFKQQSLIYPFFRYDNSIVYLAIAIQCFMLFFEHFFELVTNGFLPYLA